MSTKKNLYIFGNILIFALLSCLQISCTIYTHNVPFGQLQVAIDSIENINGTNIVLSKKLFKRNHIRPSVYRHTVKELGRLPKTDGVYLLKKLNGGSRSAMTIVKDTNVINGLNNHKIFFDCRSAARAIRKNGKKMPELYKWLCQECTDFSVVNNTNIWPPALQGRTKTYVSFYYSYIPYSEWKKFTYSPYTNVEGTGMGYKGRPIIWVFNELFYRITNVSEELWKGLLRDGDIDEERYLCRWWPTELDNYKEVQVVENEIEWGKYVQSKVLKKHYPVMVKVYTL